MSARGWNEACRHCRNGSTRFISWWSGWAPADAIALTPELYAVKKRSNRDAGQRTLRGCTVSKDIGQYNTCPHLCEYCYANAGKAIAVASLPELVYTGITRAKENLLVINIGYQQYHDFFEKAAR